MRMRGDSPPERGLTPRPNASTPVLLILPLYPLFRLEDTRGYRKTKRYNGGPIMCADVLCIPCRCLPMESLKQIAVSLVIVRCFHLNFCLKQADVEENILQLELKASMLCGKADDVNRNAGPFSQYYHPVGSALGSVYVMQSDFV